MRVGVEVGGTFTDLVAFTPGGVRVTKVPSTPGAPHEGALAALDASGLDLAAVEDLVHGSTVATNAVLERKGARVALLVTKGFRDLLLLQRHNRRRVYDLAYQKPAPVVDRSDTFEVDERLDAAGRAVVALDEGALAAALARAFDGREYDSVAICLLNSYANPEHERRVAGVVRQLLPEAGVTCSCDVSREFREYERASTTALAAYVQPVIDRYLSSFERELARRGFAGRFSVMQSNGGRLPARGMASNAITALFSGPAAGVMGAVRQAARSGLRDLVTFDMGGTSTDVCLVEGGHPEITSETEVDGLPIRTPVLDIVTVGAGGGSIVWRDDGGMLRVGPRSAGADPGPVCYRRGGEAPTVTDAHMVRGTLLAQTFLGGRMEVDRALAAAALEPLAVAFGRTCEQIADDAVRVAENNIVRAIQIVSTERGRDPRDYVLVPFGGAGPLHAARVADELGIRAICVPPAAGVLSAYGLVASDYASYASLTRRVAVDGAAPAEVTACFAEMRDAAASEFARLGIAAPPRFSHVLEMRYVGQAFEVPVVLADADLEGLTEARLLARFNAAHNRIFEFGDSRSHRAEIVSFRLGCTAPPPVVPELAPAAHAPLAGEVEVFDRGARERARLLDRTGLAAAGTLAGPLLVADDTSTAWVPRGWTARVDAHHNVLLAHRE